MMQGPHQAKLLVSQYLSEDLPSRLVKYRNHWDVDDETLPTPAEYLAHEPLAIDAWPTIITVAISTNSLTRESYNVEGDPAYRVAYSLRTYVWVRTDGPAETTIMRDRLTTVVRSALLDHPSMRTRDYANDCHVLVDEGTLREEFSDLTLLKGDRYLAGAYLAYTMQLNEVITRSTIGELSDVDVNVDVLPYPMD